MKCTVQNHVEFLAALMSEDDMDDLLMVDPYECQAPSRRSEKEVAGILAILDEIKKGKEITQ
jgi:hypothetical protein